MRVYKKITIEASLKVFLSTFLFLLPWQTVYIYHDQFLNGVKWEYGTLNFYVTEGLFWICAIMFMVWYWNRSKNYEIRIKNFRLTKDRIFVLSCLCFILYSFLSVTWAIDRNVAFQQAFRILEVFLLFFMLYLGPVPKRMVAWSFVVGAVLPSILGIWQFLSQTTIGSTIFGLTEYAVDVAGTSVIVGDDVGRWLRAYGTFPHPNMFGGYLAMTITTGLFLLYGEEDKHRRVLLHTILLVGIAALFFTFSRSAWGAVVMVLLFFCFMVVTKKQKQFIVPVISILTCASVLGIVFSPLIRVRTEMVSLHETRSITERVSGYREAVELWKEHPWKGVGAGNYTIAMFKKDPTRVGWEYQPVHNVPLLLLAELGLLGVFLLVGVFLSLTTYLLSSILDRKLLIWYLPVVACLMALVSFDHYLFSSYPGLLLTACSVAISGPFIHCLSTIHAPVKNNAVC